MGLKETLENLLVESKKAANEAKKRIEMEQARDAIDREARRKQGFLFLEGLGAVDKMRTIDRYARKIFGPPPRGFSSDSEFRERVERKPSGEIIGNGILIMRVVAGIDHIDIGDSKPHYVETSRLDIRAAYNYQKYQDQPGFYVGKQDPRDSYHYPLLWRSVKPCLWWTPERFEQALVSIVQIVNTRQ